MKKIERTEYIKIIEYKGNCPKCKEEIISSDSDVDDVLCYECKEKEDNKKLKDIYKWLLDAKITNITGNSYSISSIIVKVNNKEFSIKSEGHGHYLHIDSLNDR